MENVLINSAICYQDALTFVKCTIFQKDNVNIFKIITIFNRNVLALDKTVRKKLTMFG